MVHSMAVYAFAAEHEIHRFLDFTYEHVTIDRRRDKGGCVIWGAIQAGYMDRDYNVAIKKFQKKYLADRGCQANVTELRQRDLSPTYSHLSESWRRDIALQTISVGKVEMKVGLLSG